MQRSFQKNHNTTDLFQQSDSFDVGLTLDSNYDEELERRIQQSHIMTSNESNRLQLERIIGNSGLYPFSVQFDPANNNMIRIFGSLISIEDMFDITKRQHLLRGHDMNISALAVSKSGNFYATGQEGTKYFKGFSAPIFLWNKRGKRLLTFRGITIRVNIIQFSIDERFLCATGEDSLMIIWKLDTAEIVYSYRSQSPISVISWIDSSSKDCYNLAYGFGSNLFSASLSFDPVRVSWKMKVEKFALPPSAAIIRTYLCMSISKDNNYIILGTSAGEMLVFRRDTMIFRAAIPVCTNGVHAIVVENNTGVVLCGGGDGVIRKYLGADTSWKLDNETFFEGSIISLSLSTDGKEFLAATTTGSIYRCLVDDFRSILISSTHQSQLNSLSVSIDSSSYIATGSISGELRIYDANDYASLAKLKNSNFGSVCCLKIYKNEMLISGWEDGFIRCHDLLTLNRQIWILPNAHRGAVTTIDVHSSQGLQYMVSGGSDGIVRVWKLSNCQLICQYNEHKKSIKKILIDCKASNVVHSISLDGTIVSYDLKINRKIAFHMVPDGMLSDVTQHCDGECELLTCDTHGKVLKWDIDYQDPSVITIEHQSLNTCSVSPSGRYFAFGGDDQLLKVYDNSKNCVIGVGIGHTGTMSDIKWSSDEKRLITINTDSCLCIWKFS